MKVAIPKQTSFYVVNSCIGEEEKEKKGSSTTKDKEVK